MEPGVFEKPEIKNQLKTDCFLKKLFKNKLSLKKKKTAKTPEGFEKKKFFEVSSKLNILAFWAK